MLKVHPIVIILAMMANAFLLYVFTEVGKMPRNGVVTWALIGLGGSLASLGVLLGLVTSKVSVVTDEAQPAPAVKVEVKP